MVADPQPSAAWPCGLAGRRPVLAVALSPEDPDARQHAIVYSVGSAPSPIWRGQVLMRCGPAYGLDKGLTAGGTALNRVVIDGLTATDPEAFCAKMSPSDGILRLALTQEFASGGRKQTLRSQRQLDLTGLELL